ncbi:MAG: alpha/beta fold hydrolase [Myxococcota bacterium]
MHLSWSDCPTSFLFALAVIGSSCTTDEGSATASDSSSGGVAASSSDTGEPGSTTAPASTSTTGADDTSDGEGTAQGCTPAAGPLVSEELSLMAADGTELAATVARPTEGTCLPGLLLIHQFANDRSQWDALLPTFVDAGYVALALDLRGHGDSGPQQGALSDILTDPDQAPLDVAAALDWLRESPSVDGARLGAVGTSIGANLTVVALHEGSISAAVPISTRLEAVEALAGMPKSLTLGNLFCLATDGDNGGVQADSCTQLVADATGETRVEIIEGSSAHGVTLLSEFPEVVPEILEWLGTTL